MLQRRAYVSILLSLVLLLGNSHRCMAGPKRQMSLERIGLEGEPSDYTIPDKFLKGLMWECTSYTYLAEICRLMLPS